MDKTTWASTWEPANHDKLGVMKTSSILLPLNQITLTWITAQLYLCVRELCWTQAALNLARQNHPAFTKRLSPGSEQKLTANFKPVVVKHTYLPLSIHTEAVKYTHPLQAQLLIRNFMHSLDPKPVMAKRHRVKTDPLNPLLGPIKEKNQSNPQKIQARPSPNHCCTHATDRVFLSKTRLNQLDYRRTK